MSQLLFTFALSTEKMKLFNECVIYYFDYLKTILNDDLSKQYINPSVFIDFKYLLKIHAVILIKKVYFFNGLPLKYML